MLFHVWNIKFITPLGDKTITKSFSRLLSPNNYLIVLVFSNVIANSTIW